MGTGSQLYFDAQAAAYDERSRRGLWSIVREREASAVLAAAGAVGGREALELGCGSGFYTARLQARGARVLGVDSSSAMVSQLEAKGLRGHLGEVLSLSLGKKFSLVIAAGLLEFIDDEAGFFRVAREHCEPDGTLVLLVPRSGFAGLLYRSWHSLYGVPTKIRTRAVVEAAARQAGWAPDLCEAAGPLAVVMRFRALAGNERPGG